eukprot:scaffold1687_cov405-Prasinococcus_capsulatus_cf.AAC.5
MSWQPACDLTAGWTLCTSDLFCRCPCRFWSSISRKLCLRLLRALRILGRVAATLTRTPEWGEVNSILPLWSGMLIKGYENDSPVTGHFSLITACCSATLLRACTYGSSTCTTADASYGDKTEAQSGISSIGNSNSSWVAGHTHATVSGIQQSGQHSMVGSWTNVEAESASGISGLPYLSQSLLVVRLSGLL